MAQSPTPEFVPLTEDVFLADRQKFWNEFTGATTAAASAVVVLLILLAVFLV